MTTDPTLSILEPVKLRSGAEHVADRLPSVAGRT